MYKTYAPTAFRLVLIAALASSVSACAEKPVGSKSRPFTMLFVPSVDSEKINTNSLKLKEFLEKKISQSLYGTDTGFYVKTMVPNSYVAVVEALGTSKADFAVFNTFGYVLAKDIKAYPIEAVLTVIRGDGEMTYKGQIITRADSGITKLEQLKGKKFAYTDPASTAGFILPSKLLKDLGVELGETVFAQKHDNVVTMVYQRQVDAGATYYTRPEEVVVNGKKTEKLRDARARVLTQFPDVGEKVKIIGFTAEIPNEPWVIRTNLYKDPSQTAKVRQAVVEGLLEFSKTDAGRDLLMQVATSTALAKIDDSKYAAIRATIKEAQVDLESVLKKQK